MIKDCVYKTYSKRVPAFSMGMVAWHTLVVTTITPEKGTPWVASSATDNNPADLKFFEKVHIEMFHEETPTYA